MIALLNSAFNLISIIMRFLEKRKSNKKDQLDIERNNKAKAYEKLQKTIKARMASRKSITVDNVISDDGYKRD